MNGRRGEEDLAVLIERSADLKRDLVEFACSPRWQRSLAAATLEAGLEEVDEGDAISAIDRFAPTTQPPRPGRARLRVPA